MICPLWACSSCQEDEYKLPSGTKPEMLKGKWEGNYSVNPIFTYETVFYSEIYEFTQTGGSITSEAYFPYEDRYGDPQIIYFADWCYDGKNIYFTNKNNKYTGMSREVHELTLDSFILNTGILKVYYKIK
jgi:hypothetical protein